MSAAQHLTQADPEHFGRYGVQNAKYGSTEEPNALEEWEDGIVTMAPYVAEFLGTFVLVFTVGCCVLLGDGTMNALAIGSALMVMIFATGSVSGGNLNPAVSFTLWVTRKLEFKVMLGYWIAQFGAGAVASLSFVTLVQNPRNDPIVLGPKSEFTIWHAGLAEVLYTCMLCFVVASCAASKRNNPKPDGNQFFALAIGFVILAGGYAAGDISGACFNPAVSMGLDIANTADGCCMWVAYSGFQILGALFAAAFFRICRPEDYKHEDFLEDYQPTFLSKAIGELFGTFMLVLTVGLNLVMNSQATALSAGACLTCFVYSLGDVSGGHFNPAVTLATMLRGKTSWLGGLGIILVQLVAGIQAGLVYQVFHRAGPNANRTYSLPGAEECTLLGGCNRENLGAAGGAELVFTCVLAFVVLATATVSKKNWYFGLAIGSCVIAGGFAIGAVSGGELNPAVSTGIYLANLLHHGSAAPSGVLSWLQMCIYELIGGVAAAIIFRLMHGVEFQEKKKPLLGRVR